MVRMAFLATFLVVFLLNIFQLNFISGAQIGRRKVEVIHNGRPLQDLVILHSRITPHDLEYLNAFVKPKLLEDSKAEGMMLQKNGIEDFRPLDVTLETEEYPSNNVQYQDGTDQASNADNSNENGGLDLKGMPEYKSETKADYKANQEAIDWMMKDPNDFNVKSYEDSSLLEDTDNLSHNKFATINDNQGEGENNINTHLHHRNYGSKRHHAASDSGVQDYSHHTDNTLPTSNEISIESNRHRHKETTEWNDNDDDKENDFQSNDLQEDYDNDGTDNARYEDLNEDNDENYNSKETSMKNLNQRIRNQDAKLFKELENFQNVDNTGNLDQTDVLGNVDEQRNGFGNIEEDNEGVDDHNDESNSHDEDKISNTNEKSADETNNESENKNELEDENASESESESESERGNRNDQGNGKENGSVKTNENEVANESQNDSDSENGNDNGSNKESKVKSGSKGQEKSENGNEDIMDSTSSDKVQNDDNDGNSVPQGRKDEKYYSNGQRETTGAEDIGSDQQILGIKTNDVHINDKLQRIKDRTSGKKESHKEVHQSTNDSSSDESFVGLEERITNEIKEFMSLNKQEDSGSSKQLKEPKLDSNSESKNHNSMETVGKEGGRQKSSPTAETVGHSKSDKLGHVNRKLEQEQHPSIENDNGHNFNEQNVVSQEKIRTAFSNAENGRHTDETNTSSQRSKSNANETSTPSYQDQNELVITTDEPLIPAEKTATINDEQQLFHHKENQMTVKDEQNPGTTRPALVERIKAQSHREKIHKNNGNGKRPTTTGFRRNQPMHGPSSSIFSLADALKIQNIISYLRGTTTSTSLPTESPSSGPNRFSLKSLYYYPVHPTPQEQPEDNSEAKSLMFSEWNDWSTCSVTCGKGTSVRARVCLVTSCPQKDLLQTKSCQRSICADDLERESLEEHNELRAKHFSPPLLWSRDLTRKAQAIAQRLAKKDFLTLNDLQEPQGESLAQIQYSDEHLAKKAIDKWYSEIKSYSFSYPKINPKTRHFVQIVWKETKEMGLAVAKSPNENNAFVVALYNPPLVDGHGHLRQNVLRPGMKNDLYSTIKRKRGSAVNVL